MEARHPPRKEMMPLKRPQMKIVLLVCCVLVLTCIVVSILQTYFLLSALTATGQRSAFADKALPIACLVALITLLVMVPAFMFIAVWVSYRLLGPIRRVAREMESVGEGRIGGGFTLRTGDDLTFLGASVAEMKEKLARRIQACRQAEDSLDKAVQRLEAEVASGAPNRTAPVVAELKQSLAALRAELDQFKT